MSLHVTVAVALPAHQEVIALELPDGSRVADALEAAGIARRFPELAGARVGIWAKPCDRETKLRDGDRIELYRPLAADPKAMRRARARRPR